MVAITGSSSTMPLPEVLLPLAIVDAYAYPSKTFCPLMRLPGHTILSDIEEDEAVKRFTGVKCQSTEALTTDKWANLLKTARKMNRAMYILGCVQHKDAMGRIVYRCYDGSMLKKHLEKSDADPITRMQIDQVYFLALKFFHFDKEGEKKELPESEQAFEPLLEELDKHRHYDRAKPLSSRVSPLIAEAIELLDCTFNGEEDEKAMLGTKSKKVREALRRNQCLAFAFMHLQKNAPREFVQWSAFEAQSGLARAQMVLGDYYLKSENKTAAFKWFLKAAEQGDCLAQYYLGEMYRKGDGITKDLAEAMKWHALAAEQGDMDSQFAVGMNFYDKQDFASAHKWYLAAAKQGKIEAQLNLAVLYWNGQGVEEDLWEAFQWCAKAATQGNIIAQRNLGAWKEQCHSFAEAYNWFSLAAKQGCPIAQYKLGNFNEFGKGKDIDLAEAYKWYHAAAIQKLADAQSKVGVFLFSGQGTSINKNEGVKWYLAAAEQGHVGAQYNLGECLRVGEGTPKNLLEAEKWYQKAVDQGFSAAEEALKELRAVKQEERKA